MQVVRTISDLRHIRRSIENSVGTVFTMGALHAGHLELVNQARLHNDVVIATIFVNPTQFAPGEDFLSYPRNQETDLKLLEENRVDVVFIPSDSEMYPEGFATGVDIGELGRKLEGVVRPGHFNGVSTVVLKLLNLVRPHKAYFGQKDFQQLVVIRKLADDLNLGIAVEAVETVREPDGLAMSSRNVYLDSHERLAARAVPESLNLASACYSKGVRRASDILSVVRDYLDAQPLIKVDYLSITTTNSLDDVEFIENTVLFSLAVYIGKTRLIDNVVLGDE